MRRGCRDLVDHAGGQDDRPACYHTPACPRALTAGSAQKVPIKELRSGGACALTRQGSSRRRELGGTARFFAEAAGISEEGSAAMDGIAAPGARTDNQGVLRIKTGRRRGTPACRPTRRPGTRSRIRSRRCAGAGGRAAGAAPRPSCTCCSCTEVCPARCAARMRGGLLRDQAGRRQQVPGALGWRWAGCCLPGATRPRGQESPRPRIPPSGRPRWGWPARKGRRALIRDPPADQAGCRPQHRNAQLHMRARWERRGGGGRRTAAGRAKRRRVQAASYRPPISTGWHRMNYCAPGNMHCPALLRGQGADPGPATRCAGEKRRRGDELTG